MVVLLYGAAALLVVVGLAHSYLGERYVLMRLFRRADLPELFGGQAFTRRTLRFAWHVTSLAWWGLAGVCVVLAHPPSSVRMLGWVVAVTLWATAAVVLVGSRGRHLAWPVFAVAGALVSLGTRT